MHFAVGAGSSVGNARVCRKHSARGIGQGSGSPPGNETVLGGGTLET